jgi:hypothetical protein
VKNPLTGGPGLVEVSAASLLAGPLPVGRAELRVSGGLAAAWAEMRDNVTGDPMSMAFSGPDGNAGSLIVNGAWHGAAPDGTQLQTDVRIFNPSPSAQDVNIFSSGVGGVVITLPPHSMQELTDVVQSQLKASPAGPISLQILTNTSTVIAAARTAVIAQPGPGIHGELHEALPFDPAGDGPQVTTTYGLATGTPAGIVVARSDPGGVFQAALRDSLGNLLMGSSSITVAGGASAQAAMADLFPGITIPDGARLEISVLSGTVEAGLLLLAPGSGDPAYRETALLPQSASCAFPVITSVSASQTALAKPGSVSVNWQTALADSVDLTPAATGLSSSGSTTLSVTQSTTYQLTAHNACGDSTEPLLITVGPPAPSSLAVITGSSTAGASAQPGQLIRVHVNNIDSPTAVDSVLFQGGGEAYAVTPESFYTTGDLDVRVPYWVDGTAPNGYRTGAMTVGVSVGGVITGSLPVTVQPLSFSGDPVAAFTSIID